MLSKLPSRATQQARRAALPDREELARRLRAATADLPLRAEKLAPFLDDVDTARSVERRGGDVSVSRILF